MHHHAFACDMDLDVCVQGFVFRAWTLEVCGILKKATMHFGIYSKML
jgi:hypothetical protein